MQAYQCFFILLLSSILFALSCALSDHEASFLARRQLSTLPENGNLPDNYEFEVNVEYTFPNSRLRRAYIALKAWKEAVYSDPSKFTSNWKGPDVCNYTGVFCSPSLDDPSVTVVAGIDLNHADIAGYLPVELGLLTDVALFHLNSNRFCGIIPESFSELTLMHELDLSNNRLVGPFPKVVLKMPGLKYLDLRFNNFEGELPPQLFDKDLDALFLNDNRFVSIIPETLGNSSASVIVFANNKFHGCIPSSIGKMSNLDEIVFMNNNLGGCLPVEVGLLKNVTVFNAAGNSLSGILPKTLDGLSHVEQLDLSHNSLTGFVPENLCRISSLKNFTFSFNYFNGEAKSCEPGTRKDVTLVDTNNCLPDRPKQKSQKRCQPIVSKPIDCSKDKCGGPSTKSPPHKKNE
ncbi:peroxin, partial [Datura stramonium]|nr:peroxin [Datura stramonium]